MENKEYGIIRWISTEQSFPPIGMEVFFKTNDRLFYGIYGSSISNFSANKEIGFYDYLKKKKRKSVKYWGRLID